MVMSLRLIERMVPRVRGTLHPWRRGSLALSLPRHGQTRNFYRGPFSREPFTQMEEFMKDMERRFRRDIDDTVGSFFRSFPAKELPASAVVARTNQPSFGQIENLSTVEKYKLNFYFPNAKPENIKVTLKGGVDSRPGRFFGHQYGSNWAAN